MKNLKQVCQAELARTNLLDLNWEEPRVYAEWLAQTYHYAAFSTRIIGLAACHFDYHRDDLHHKFLDHAREEKHHEKILPVDLKNLGYALEQFRPSESAKILFQNQYYWIQNVNPISVYGYFLYLEGLAVDFGPKIYERLKKAHPEKASRYLKVHVEEDQGHVDGHYNFIDKLDHSQQLLIEENLMQTSFVYRQFLKEIESNSQSQVIKKVS